MVWPHLNTGKQILIFTFYSLPQPKRRSGPFRTRYLYIFTLSKLKQVQAMTKELP